MPFKTGLQVIEEVRKFYKVYKDRLIEPQFAIVTAFATPVFRNYLSKMSIFCCLDKPISMADLEDLLRSRQKTHPKEEIEEIEEI